jgi:hypothetical protein
MDATAGPDRHWRGRLQEPEQSDDIAGPNDQPLSSFWQTAVRNYTRCNLTERSDKLIALWGIAKLLKDAMGVEYGEGLWEGNLEDQLTWRVAECKLKARPEPSKKRKIPSWSWASMDGEIVVADRLSNRPHWTVCDHNGHPLELDLVGVKRYARSSLFRPSGPGPVLQHRVQSDSVLEVKPPKTTEKKDGSHAGENKTAKKFDEDAEPVLHTSSIPIQGYVNHGMLGFDATRKAWVFCLQDGADLDIEAYPDLVPGSTNFQESSDFVVLSAKKVIQPKSEVSDMQSGQDRKKADIEIEGRGILLEFVAVDPKDGKDHYRRTGAFRFRVANEQVFEQSMLVTVGDEISSSEKVDVRSNRKKFWLD